MTIRRKIFLLAGILLALFGLVVAALAVFQRFDSDQISNIDRYELPLSRLLAEFDVDTDRYELHTLRLLQRDQLNPAELQAAIADRRDLADAMRRDVGAATALLKQATNDPSYRTAERVDLARIDGSFSYLVRSLEDFLAVGDKVMTALADGRHDEAQAASLDFARFAEAFGPDLSKIRRQVADLTERATAMVLASQRLDTYLSFALFLIACGLGLGISALGSTQVVGGLRRLLASTRAIEAGGESMPVLIQTHDDRSQRPLPSRRLRRPPGAMPSSSRPSRTQSTNGTPNSRNGSATTSILTQTRPHGSPPKLRLSPKNGRGSHLQGAPSAADPWPSPEGHGGSPYTTRARVAPIGRADPHRRRTWW